MKILHTSDWHIGHTLYGKKRLDEHEKFLSWLSGEIRGRGAGALIVAGDVFDTAAPGGAAQKLYYDFLTSLLGTCCATVIIVAGNHDSPGLLEAPAGVLERLNIHTIGLPSEAARHVVPVTDREGNIGAICCAVPYLRKCDMLKAEDDSAGADGKIALATAAFYKDVTREAQMRKEELGQAPLIATGHLFAAGAVRSEGDGVRELYVGSLGQVGADIFPEALEYVALGHIHGEQCVAGSGRIRYCGSPLHMSFSELDRKKYIIEIDTDGMKAEKIEVPVFQRMKAVSGDYTRIMDELCALAGEDVWIEATYTGKEIIPGLSADIFSAVRGGRAEVLGIKNDAVLSAILESAGTETLDTISVKDVFMRALQGNDFSDAVKKELIDCFDEILAGIEEAV